ncbi:MAG: hydroxyethylthiazole kinase [Candidatus Omnitrophica bacterium]|nr:hydroxyethylthiazole kinase [Candidatus Omnitrophota bacterium]
MKKTKFSVYSLLDKVKKTNPLVHHITNWVTISDCAQILKSMGASPVMAHAKEEASEMVSLSSALVLNIGTITSDVLEAMMIASFHAREKGIPVILDACGAGATQFRDQSCFRLLDSGAIRIVKGNRTEIARLNGSKIATRGVDAGEISQDLVKIAKELSRKIHGTVVITGAEDIVADKNTVYVVKNGHPLMARIVGTGCMAASVIGAFAAVHADYAEAAVAALACFEIAAELSAEISSAPVAFKHAMFDCLSVLDKKTIDTRQKIYIQ